MDVQNEGGGQATRADRVKRLSRTAVLTVAVLFGLALVVGLRTIVRAQTLKNSPFTEFSAHLLGGSQIGVTVRDVEASDVTREKLPGRAGAVVDEVQSDGPAAKAGIKAGDVIVSFDGERIRSARHFARLIEETPDGREVEATVVRAGERVSLKVAPVAAETFAFDRLSGLKGFALHAPDAFTLTMPKFDQFERFQNKPGDFPMDLFEGRRPFTLFGRFERGRLGVGVQDLTGQLGEYFGASGGVLVTEVDDGTPAKTAGIKAGDVITKVNGESIRDANDLRRRLGEVSGETRISLMRDRKEQTLTIKIEDERVINRQRIRR